MRQTLRFFPCLVALVPAGAMSAEEELPIEKLVELNGEAVFGAKARLEGGDRLVVAFDKPGQFEKCFAGRGMKSPDSLKGDLNRKILENPVAGGELQNVAVVGQGNGQWVSKFDLSGDIDLNFTMRVQAVSNRSQFLLTLNQAKKDSLQIFSFFQGAVAYSGGKKVKQAAAPKEFQAPPDKWFDRNALATIHASLKGGSFSLHMKMDAKDPKEGKKDQAKKEQPKKEHPRKEQPKKDQGKKEKEEKEHKEGKKDEKESKDPKDVEMLKLDDLPASGGKISFTFQNLNFVLINVTIAGKVDREWLKAQFQELKAKGTLKAKEAPKPPELPPLRQPKKEEPGDKKKEDDEDL